MNPAEADILVQSLVPISIEKIGSSAWKEQREAIELLNFCSHTNANLKKDDFVMASLIKHEKMVVLLHELLVMDVWRRKIFPSISKEVIESPSGVYLYYNYEMILLNFLECLMYFEESVVAFEDSILELLDYSWRQVNLFLAQGNAKISTVPPPLDPKSPPSTAQQFASQEWEMQCSRALTSITILWFIIDRLEALPMAVINAVLQKNDLLVGFADVLLAQPWQRRGKEGVQKFINGRYTPVSDPLRICVPEAHSWFAMHKLLCDRECRKKYAYTTYKKEAIIRVKRFLNETLVDQIPALVDVQRALEELSFLEPPSGTEEKFKSTLIIEPVAQLMESIEGGKNFNQLAENMARMLNDPRSKMEDAQRLSRIFDQMME